MSRESLSQDIIDKAKDIITNQKIPPTRVAKMLGISKTSLFIRLRKEGFLPEKNIDEEKVRNLYNEWKTSGMTITKFTKEKHIGGYEMTESFRKLGLDTGLLNNKIYCNDKAFDTITEESAYWIGFLTADGYISKDYKSLELSLKDRDHVVKFKKFLNSEHNIETRIVKSNNAIIYRLTIGSMYLCERLMRLGIINNKTYQPLIISYEIVNSDYLGAYLRGYFEGDGHYVFNCNKIPINLGITTYSEKDITVLQNVLSNKFNITPSQCSIYNKRNDHAPQFIIRKEAINKFIDIMYKNATIYLDRKYEVYIKYFAV